MTNIWQIEISDGADTVELIYLPAEVERDEIVKWMLWRAYHEKQWEIFEDVEAGDTVLVQTYKDDPDAVDLYCCNMIPDVLIRKVELTEIGEYGDHGMELNEQVHVPFEERIGWKK